MKRWEKIDAIIALSNFNKMTHEEISEKIGKSPSAVAEWLRLRGHLKRPNYTETEVFLLENFPVNHCAPFIPHKTKNALRIKKHRLLKLT